MWITASKSHTEQQLCGICRLVSHARPAAMRAAPSAAQSVGTAAAHICHLVTHTQAVMGWGKMWQKWAQSAAATHLVGGGVDPGAEVPRLRQVQASTQDRVERVGTTPSWSPENTRARRPKGLVGE